MQQAKWTGYFKVVDPQSDTVKVTDNISTDASAYNNYSWYQRLVHGSSSRISRYQEYDVMDQDVDVARALDLIAEEMTNKNSKTGLPLNVDLTLEDGRQVADSLVATIRVALKHWCIMHKMNIKLFDIARHTLKYGDLFFRNIPGQKKWEYINSKHVVAAVVDSEDVTKIVAYQIRKDVKKPRQNAGGSVPVHQEYETEIVPAPEVVRFTLNDDMSDMAPFGESVLSTIYRVQKQKELLEDAIVIYRVQRAPERRVFYIDVGKMPPQRTKQYLETIKNEIRQKKVPSVNGGTSNIDSTYNPQSMCLALDTEIPLLDGRTCSLSTLILEHEKGIENWVYSADPSTGEVAPGIISWAGVTQSNAETIELTLDNGETITCTPEHKFPVQGKGFVEAQHLTECDSLWPYQSRQQAINKQSTIHTSEYTQIYNPATKSWTFVHRMVAKYMKKLGLSNEFNYDSKYSELEKQTIHHSDFNHINNNPENLVWMNSGDHTKYHMDLCPNQEAVFPLEMIARFQQISNDDIHITFNQLMAKLNNDDEFMSHYQNCNRAEDGKKYKLKTSKFRQKMFLRFINVVGFQNWMDYQQYVIQSRVEVESTHLAPAKTTSDVKLIQYILSLVKTISIRNFGLVNHMKQHTNDWNKLVKLYEASGIKSNKTKPGTYQILTKPESSLFERIAKYFGYRNFIHLVTESSNFNHRVVNIQKGSSQDVGTLTIDQGEKLHGYHTFALSSGVFTKNSEDFYFAQRPNGAGSRVETLPGGQNLGELADLEYFRSKVMEGLRIPPSYLPNFETQDSAGSFSDGNVGTAYMQEIQFFKYVDRLQQHLNEILDVEFKRFLKELDIHIDETMYQIRLPIPTNFEKYKESAVDGELLSQFGNADGIEYMSKRFVLSRYLKLSPDEIATNEMLLRQERGMDPNDGKALVKLYNPDLMDMEAPDDGGEGGGGGGFGGEGFDDGELEDDGDDGDDSVVTDQASDDSTPTETDNTDNP